MYTVYLVDDEEWVLSLLKHVIPWKEYGCTLIGSSTDAISALREIRALQPDMVFTDIRMPGMSGLDLIEKLGGANAVSEFVIVTGHDEFEYARTALHNRVAAYLLKPVDEEELIQILCTLIDRLSARRNGDQTRLEEQRRLRKLSRMLSEDAAPVSGPDSSGTDPRIDKAMKIIKEEYHLDLSLKDLSERVFISECYFSDMFKRHAGKSFSDYLCDYRMAHAAQLLLRPELKIREVAAMVGYRNPNYFCRVFKRRMHVSPGEYRRGQAENRKNG